MAKEHVYTQVCPQCKSVNMGTAANCENCNHRLKARRYATRGELFYAVTLRSAQVIWVVSPLFLLIYFWNVSFTAGITRTVLSSGWVPVAVISLSMGPLALFLRLQQRPFFQRHPATLQLLLILCSGLLILGFLMLLASSAFSRSGFIMTLLLLSGAVAGLIYRIFPVGSRWLTILSSLCGLGALWFLADLMYLLPEHMAAPLGVAGSIDISLGLAMACLTGSVIVFSYKLTLLHQAEGSHLIGQLAKASYFGVVILGGFAATLLSTTLNLEGLVLTLVIMMVFVLVFVVGK